MGPGAICNAGPGPALPAAPPAGRGQALSETPGRAEVPGTKRPRAAHSRLRARDAVTGPGGPSARRGGASSRRPRTPAGRGLPAPAPADPHRLRLPGSRGGDSGGREAASEWRGPRSHNSTRSHNSSRSRRAARRARPCLPLIGARAARPARSGWKRERGHNSSGPAPAAVGSNGPGAGRGTGRLAISGTAQQDAGTLPGGEMGPGPLLRGRQTVVPRARTSLLSVTLGSRRRQVRGARRPSEAAHFGDRCTVLRAEPRRSPAADGRGAARGSASRGSLFHGTEALGGARRGGRGFRGGAELPPQRMAGPLGRAAWEGAGPDAAA